jgi:hypothetical protein
MADLLVPPVPDLARIEGCTVSDVFEWLIRYYNQDIIPWNYRVSTKCVKAGYRGLHSLKTLLDACSKEKIKHARKANQDVVELAAPLAFGRKTQVFDLPRRQFPFGRKHHAGYRVPFFFVENGIVKLYFLQPRKLANLSYEQICMVATIHKRYLLDTEFFGQPCDVEYVDVSVHPLSNDRILRQYSLSTLELWDDKRLGDRLTLIAEALERVKESGLVQPRRRAARTTDSEMPAFRLVFYLLDGDAAGVPRRNRSSGILRRIALHLNRPLTVVQDTLTLRRFAT